MKRILILSSEFPPGPGGIGTHAFQLAKYISAKGWKVQVLSPQDYASEAEIKTFNNKQPFGVDRLASFNFKPLQTFMRFHSIRREFRRFKPNLVMASGSHAIWISATLLLWRKVPWVVVGHGTEFGAQRGMDAWITRVTCNRADRVICVSNYTKDMLQKMGITKPPSNVIHNGADHTQFYRLPEPMVAAFRKDQSVSDRFVLLTVGNVSDRKGQEIVVRALPKIKQSLPNVEYWMAGIPKKRVELEALAKSLGVVEYIRFWGRVSDDLLLKLYNACNLFIMTSRHLSDGDFEGYGIAVIEAALCGKPAIVTKNSGLAEAVHNNQTGLLVPQNDPDQTADSVLLLANNLKLLSILGNQTYQNALENQTWEQVVVRYDKVFEEVLAGISEGSP